ncbi:unnamed protein product [Effrenium voratum]|nr:unnamed protein product [Effrenium voratum]
MVTSHTGQRKVQSGATGTIQEDSAKQASALNQKATKRGKVPTHNLMWNASPAKLAGLRCSLLAFPCGSKHGSRRLPLDFGPGFNKLLQLALHILWKLVLL